MFDDSGDSAVVFLFDDIADQLLEQGSDLSPAAIHGCFSGMLVAGADSLAEVGLDGLAQAQDLVAHGELAAQLMQLYRATDDSLRNDDFSFQPLLPDDDVDIQPRTEALAGWCSGFLAGISHASAQGRRAATWSGEAKEIMQDIGAMSQAEVGEEDGGEEAEESYAEIVEYIRFAVLNLFMEATAIEDNGDGSPDPGATLH